MKLIGCSITSHDQTWYDGKTNYVAERYSRVKGNRLGTRLDPVRRESWINPQNYAMCKFYEDVIEPFWDEYDVLAMSIPRNPTLWEFYSHLTPHRESTLGFEPKTLFEHYYKDKMFYADHHQAHAVYAYLQSGFDECDIFAIDGGGHSFTSFFADKDQNVQNLSETFSLGRTWIFTTSTVGRLMEGRLWLDHEVGKVMGLAAFGNVNKELYSVLDELSRVAGKQRDFDYEERKLNRFCLSKGISGADLSATMQHVSNHRMVELLLEHKTSDSVCLSGGVAYNGYMNEMITKIYKNVYVPPAVGDEGQSLGMYMMADYVLNNNTHIPSVYAGAKHEVKEEIFR